MWRLCVALIWVGTVVTVHAEPLVVMQTRPIEELVGDVQALVKQGGQAWSRVQAAVKNEPLGIRGMLTDEFMKSQNLMESVFGFLSKELGRDWNQHIDSKLPLLGYITYNSDDPEQSAIIIMVPIRSQRDDFRKYLGRIAEVGREGEKGDFSITFGGNWAIHGRLSKNWLYLSLNGSDILTTASLASPDDLTAPLDGQLATMRFFPQRIPLALRTLLDFAFQTAEAEVQRRAEIDPDLPEAARGLQKQWGLRLLGLVRDIIKEGEQVSLGIAYDRRQMELGTDIRVRAKADTALAKSFIAAPPVAISPVGPLLDGEPAMQFALNFPIPLEVSKLFEEGVREEFSKDLPTPKERALLEDVITKLRPTYQKGQIQLGGAVHTTPAGSTFIGAVAIQNSAELEKMFREVAEFPGSLWQLDLEKQQGINIHSMLVPEEIQEPLVPSFGGGELYFAFRKDALMFAYGADARARLRRALLSKPKPTPQMMMQISAPSLVQLVSTFDEPLSKRIALVIGKESDNQSVIKLEWQTGETFKLRCTSYLWPTIAALAYIIEKRSQID